jgi:Fe-Mn family superoxide dismutase
VVTGPFSLPPLPYAEDALAPVISANTMAVHYGKHHKTYVDNLNNLVKDADNAAFATLSLEDVIRQSVGSDKRAIFNNAAQISHHSFYWASMKPGGGGAPPAGALSDLITKSFGSYDKFKEQFIKDATGIFGSGWCWLVKDGDVLKIVKTSNADLPTGTPLSVIDVWEHAYYLDYKNLRKDYVTAWLDKLINWDHAAGLLK